MNKIRFTQGSESYTGFAERVDGKLWLYFNGKTYMATAGENSARRSRGLADVASGELVAPLPGKIVKIEVQANQEISPQQVLLVMEAMKMEYTLKAQAKGQVREIHCHVGEQVAMGKLLMKVDYDG